MPPVTATELAITCASCKHEYPLKENTHGHHTAPDVMEYVITCPSCNLSTHVSYESPKIAEARTNLNKAIERWSESSPQDKAKRWEQYKVSQAAFTRLYQSEQKRWKQKRHARV